MHKIILVLILSITLLFSNEATLHNIIKLSNKGEKIAKALCTKEKLPSAVGTIEQLVQKIQNSQACPALSKAKLEAVAYYISNGSMQQNANHLQVPKGAKCPVCGMFVSKYPKWAASMTYNNKTLYFDGVKDMMKYYIFDGDFIYDRKAITQIMVTDYYTLEAIDAKEAFYVNDSTIFGPMGRELIPFKSLKSAKAFEADHSSRGIVKFDKITDAMIMRLDGLESE